MIEEEGARRARLADLRAKGINPYPTSAVRTHTTAQFNAVFRDLVDSQQPLTLVGRMLAVRKHGGMTFVSLEDDFGGTQIALKRDDIGEERYQFFHDHFDHGDFIEVRGVAYLTKTEEPTVLVSEVRLLTKTLLPLPEKWHGLSDTEVRYRKRYLDMASNPTVREVFKMRSRVVHAVRTFLHDEGFMEVETPILQPLAGGAEARPFVTHHNALDADLYLRIAPELYLKRCMVGGFEKVFELARCFRNEGISFQHNPEFTQVECYSAYTDRDQMIDHLEGLLMACVKAATGGAMQITHGEDLLDFSKIARASFYDLVLKDTGINLSVANTEEALRAEMKRCQINEEGIVGFGELCDEVWKKRVRVNIIQPTFVFEYPSAMKPLAKRSKDDPEKAENVQLLVKGMEVINGWSELNDPLEQLERFEEQEAFREQGSEDAHRVDHDYIEALKIGMPPAAGYGMGIDRLCAILSGNHSIKEVILFPTLKPEAPVDESVSMKREKTDDVFGAIKQRLEEKKIAYITKHHGSRPEDSDEALGFDPAKRPHHQGAKAIIVKGKKTGKFYHFVLPDDCKLDQKKVGKIIGERFSFASPEEVIEVTSCVPGSVPPFGSVLGLVTHMDQRLKENEEIFFNAGSLTDSIRMNLADYLIAESPEEVDAAE